jgi:uncharacterized membrane protein YtjA (UPF0391 family)
MLQWAIVFFVLAICAGILGFGGIAVMSAEIARLLFFAFIVLFILASLIHALRGKTPPV